MTRRCSKCGQVSSRLPARARFFWVLLASIVLSIIAAIWFGVLGHPVVSTLLFLALVGVALTRERRWWRACDACFRTETRARRDSRATDKEIHIA